MAKDLKFASLLDVYGSVLTDKQREMLELYYNEDLSLSEIAANEGISRQGVRDSIKRGEETLTDLDGKIGMSGMIARYESILSEVSAACDEIISDCRSYTTTKNVIEKLERIKSGIDSARA